jgi:hypothetical protein
LQPGEQRLVALWDGQGGYKDISVQPTVPNDEYAMSLRVEKGTVVVYWGDRKVYEFTRKVDGDVFGKIYIHEAGGALTNVLVKNEDCKAVRVLFHTFHHLKK